MKLSTYEELSIYQNEYPMIPVCGEIFSEMMTPIMLLRKIAQVSNHYFLLESVEVGEKIGRYSFLGYDPKLRLCGKREEVVVLEGDNQTIVKTEPHRFLKEKMKEAKSPKMSGLPTFTGGFVGYFSYEMIQLSEPKLNLKESDFSFYDLMLFDKVIVFDHLKQKLFIIVNMLSIEKEAGYNKAILEIEKIANLIYDGKPLKKLVVTEKPVFKSNVTMEKYYEMVEKTKNYIYEGDIFQGVISRRMEAEYNSSLMNTYRVMRTINPSPYMYYIKCDDIEIAGVSPETMVKLVNGKLTTFPVAGTRKRGETEEEDLRLETELLADEKELAEHNMLVDLARNDIGRISEYGTVQVEEYMKIHRFSKVMHIASVVTGKLKEGLDSIDAISAMLPAGTLSGAPKYRACEIIDELEPDARGVYGGAIGYLDLSGNLDVCIAIRTAIKKGNRLYVQAGAGIVADSDPEKEYEECGNKAGAVMESILRAGEVNEL